MIELLIDKVVSVDGLRAAIAKVFATETAGVAVVHDIEGLPLADEVAIACERYLLGGEFTMHLTMHIHDPRLADHDERSVARAFARLWSARCLISDDGVNPYTMILVSPTTSKSVSLNVAKLDEEEEYWLA